MIEILKIKPVEGEIATIQEQSKQQPVTVQEESTSQKEQSIPEIKRANKPISTNKETPVSFNLKTIFDKVEEEKPVIENRNDLPAEDFIENDVLLIFEEFVEGLKAQNKIPAYNALHTAKVLLKDKHQIVFEFSSLSLSSEFDLQKDALKLMMREKLNNHSIEFNVEIRSEATQNFIKSKAEIFREMAEKNPVLLKMKNELGLDFSLGE